MMASRSHERRKTSKEWHIEKMDRIQLLRFFLIVVALFIGGRLFLIQILQHSFYQALASGQRELVKILTPERGEIYAKDRFAETGLGVIATNQELSLVYANPKQITNPQHTAKVLAPILGLDSDALSARLAKTEDVYDPLKHKVVDQEIALLEKTINNEHLTGIAWQQENARYYPEGFITASVTGFVGIVDDKPAGQYGIEQYFNDELAGREGSLNTELDTHGRVIAIGDHEIHEAQDGDTIILTIDKNIQYKACTLLSDAVKNLDAKQGTIIVMEPSTGNIFALCNAPVYDPNNYSDVEDIDIFVNDAVTDQYESGSVFKTIVMASALDAGVLTPYTTYEDTGSVQIGPYTIRNFDGKGRGVVDMTTVLENSLNTGAVFAVQKVENERWYDYIQRFGFGKQTGIQLMGEYAGNIDSVSHNKDVYAATSSYGQGITVTPMQLVTAYAAIANHGILMKPNIIDRVIKTNGYQEMHTSETIRQVISKEAAQMLGAMLVRVVDKGHAAGARVPGYFIAGKTGTAQVAKEDGVGYDPHRHKDTFIGFGPVSNPRFVMLVKIDESTAVQWAEASVVPVFGEMAKYLVNYLQILPDRENM